MSKSSVMMHPSLVALLFFSILISARAQVSGIIQDGSGIVLEGVTVFVNKSTLADTTDSNGEFSLGGIKPGLYELIAYKKGFHLFKSPIRFQDGHALRVPLTLSSELAIAVRYPVQNIKKRLAMLKDLKEQFLGADWTAMNAFILNESALTFFRSGDTLKLQSDDPVVIENPSLGYRVITYPDNTDLTIKHFLTPSVFRFVGLTPLDEVQQNEWQIAREESFLGSARHLLSSLVQQNSQLQGFTLQTESAEGSFTDSLLGPKKAAYSVLRLKGKTKILYNPFGGNNPRISWLIAPDDFAVSDAGVPLNEKSLSFLGAMASTGFATLPVNYYPYHAIQKRQMLSAPVTLFQEKVYIQTDKPYYYPGEPVWYKGYVNYSNNELKDSLSRLLYVELINPKKTLVLTRLMKIDGGMIEGDFVMPDSLKPGAYLLRAYTNLMRNFSDANFYQKTIVILAQTDKVDSEGIEETVASSPGLVVKCDKLVYHAREKITLSFSQNNEENKSVAYNLSVAVTDATQVAPLPSFKTILNGFKFDEENYSQSPASIKFPMERTIGFSGQLFMGKNRASGKVIIIKGNFESMITLPTNESGLFGQTGYDFYDSITLSMLGKNEKGRPGRIVLVPRDFHPVGRIDTVQVRIVSTQVKQRFLSELEVPRGAVTLKEVSVQARKIGGIAEGKYGSQHRIYGRERFKGPDMFHSLNAAIPALKIVYQQNDLTMQQYITFQRQANPMRLQKQPPLIEPLIYINNEFRGGGAAVNGRPAMNALLTVDPATIDHVEVFYKGAGLIAVFTRPGDLDANLFKKFAIGGFYKPRSFLSPQYSEPSATVSRDFRSTIYWNPHVIMTEQGTPVNVSFYAADLPGKYHVVVEGVTGHGKPVRSEFYFMVDE